MIPLTFSLPVAGPSPSDFEDILEIDTQDQECNEENDNIRLTVIAVDGSGLPIDISTASSLKVRLLQPDGTTAEKTAALLTSGIDGAMQYTTVAADLEQVGLYIVQGEYVIAGKKQTTRCGKFRVAANIE